MADGNGIPKVPVVLILWLRFQQLDSLNLQLLNPVSEFLVLRLIACQHRIAVLNLIDPIRGCLGSDLQRPHDPEQYGTDGIISKLPCGGSQNIKRQKETETRAEKDLVLRRKANMEGSFCLQRAGAIEASETQ